MPEAPAQEMKTSLDASFGFSSVSSEDRERLIRHVFESVAPRYDLMNDMMSFGIHRLWKRHLVKKVGTNPGQMIIDLAGGTGDVAIGLSGPGREVVVCDPSPAMMAMGRSRKGAQHLSFVEGTAERMPFPDNSADIVTIAFGLRNVTRLSQALEEILRVLKPGGRFLCLEFSRPWALVRPFYDAYSFHVIPRLGAWVAKEPAAYTYLVESIRAFPDQRSLAGHISNAGFSGVEWRNLSFGIACLHMARKDMK